MKHLKVEGHNNLLRDGDTGAIINNDKSGYSSYMMNKSIKDEESIRTVSYTHLTLPTIYSV